MWDNEGLTSQIRELLDNSENGKVTLGLEQLEELARQYNSSYRGYNSTEHLVYNLGAKLREIMIGTDIQIRRSYQNGQIIITRNNQSGIANSVQPTQPSGTVNTVPVRATDFLPTDVPKYVEQDSELDVIDAHMKMDSPISLLFVGPKGTGKTLSIAHYAEMHDIPIIQFDCNENTKKRDLIGTFILVGEEVVYQLGVLPKAIEVANQWEQAILVLEEINCLVPNAQKIANQILDWRQHVYIDELGKTYNCADDSKLLICATMNPSYYSGVFELAEDLRSRFAEYHFDYPYKDTERNMLDEMTELSNEATNAIIQLAIETRKGYEKHEYSYALSPRDIVMFADVYQSYCEHTGDGDKSLELALKTTVLNRYDDPDERKSMKVAISRTMGVDV